MELRIAVVAVLMTGDAMLYLGQGNTGFIDGTSVA